MDCYSKAAMERAMKVQEVILRAMAKKITWWQAAEIIGISDRSMRRWHERYEEHGYDGLFRPAAGTTLAQASPAGDGGAGVGAIPGSLFRSECAAFSRESPSIRSRRTRSKKTCAIDQPPTDNQSHQRFYDSPTNRQPQCTKAEDREQNPKRFRLGAHNSTVP